MSLRSTTPWAIGLSGVATGLILLLSPGAPEHDGAGPSASPGQQHPATGEPVLEGNGDRSDPGVATSASGGAQAPPETTVPTLEELWGSAPVGVPEEWAVSAMSEGARVDRDVLTAIEAMVHGVQMDVPPFNGALAFGRSDLRWLAKLLGRLEVEVAEAEASHAHLPEKQRAVDELQVGYRQVLADVAEKRVRASKLLSARFNDGTLLRDMRDKRWLSAAVGWVEAGSLWAYTSWMPARYRELLSARDLSYVLEVSREVDRLNREGPFPGATADEKSVALANTIGRFRDYLSSRDRD